MQSDRYNLSELQRETWNVCKRRGKQNRGKGSKKRVNTWEGVKVEEKLRQERGVHEQKAGGGGVLGIAEGVIKGLTGTAGV